MKHFFRKSLGLVILLVLFVQTPAQAISDFYLDSEIAFYDPGECTTDSEDETSTTSTSGETTGPEKAVQQIVWDTLINGGIDDMHAAAVMGNIDNEGGWNPMRTEYAANIPKDESKDPRVVGSYGYGMIGWTPGTRLLDSMKEAGVKGKPYTAETQAAVVLAHIQGKTPSQYPADIGKRFLATKTIEDATTAYQGTSSQKGFENPADPVGSLSKRIKSAKKFLDKFSDTSSSTSSGSESSGSTGCCPAQSSSTSGAGLSGDSNVEKAFNFFVSKGLSKEQAAGIVGNLMVESGEGLDPKATNGSHWGIAQWDSGRWANLMNFAKDKSPYNFKIQLNFIWKELPSNGLGELKKAKTPTEAATAFEAGFERSGGSALDVRQSNAEGVLKEFGDGAAATNSSSNTEVASCACEVGDASPGLGSLPPTSKKVFKAVKNNIEKLKPLYEYAAEKTGIKWEYLAALHYRESGNRPGTSLLAGETLGSTNPDGTGSGTSSAKKNAVEAAQHFIGNAKMVYGVNVKNNPSTNDLKKAFLAYNRGFMYKNAHTSPDKSPYVMAGLDSTHPIDMVFPDSTAEPSSTRGKKNANLGAMAILAGLGLENAGSSSTSCGDGSLGTCDDSPGSNDFVFPLCISKEGIKKGVTYSGTKWVWCYESAKSCHHDYAAGDIHAKVGTKVVAAKGGTVFKVDDPGGCSGGFDVPRIQIKANDGLYYYYTHMKPNSLKVREGQKIKSGEEVGVVGPGDCAQNTGPHLHIHRQSVPTTCAPCASEDANRDRHDIQPDLKKAYNALSER